MGPSWRKIGVMTSGAGGLAKPFRTGHIRDPWPFDQTGAVKAGLFVGGGAGCGRTYPHHKNNESTSGPTFRSRGTDGARACRIWARLLRRVGERIAVKTFPSEAVQESTSPSGPYP